MKWISYKKKLVINKIIKLNILTLDSEIIKFKVFVGIWNYIKSSRDLDYF